MEPPWKGNEAELFELNILNSLNSFGKQELLPTHR